MRAAIEIAPFIVYQKCFEGVLYVLNASTSLYTSSPLTSSITAAHPVHSVSTTASTARHIATCFFRLSAILDPS
jgi:hypothetical protein